MRLTEYDFKGIRAQKRFNGLERFEKRICATAPFLHGDEDEYMKAALASSDGESQVELAEQAVGEYLGEDYVVGLSSVTAAVHIALKLAAERLYGSSSGISTPMGTGRGGALCGKRVFCPDFTSADVINPIIYEGAEPIFIDVADEDWGMDPEVLEMAFQKYPDVKIVIMSHVYGFPGQVKEVLRLCEQHDAILIEDASCALGAKVDGRYVGTFGDYGIFGFDEGNIITGYGGAMLATYDIYTYQKAKYWAEGARSNRSWAQHNELGYDYRMSELCAAMIRSQMPHIEDHIARKKEIYERYDEKFEEGYMQLIWFGEEIEPNYCYSCMLADSNIQFGEARDDRDYVYVDAHGTTGPLEICEVMEAFNVECKPVYQSMHLQPVFRMYEQMTLDGGIRRFESFFQDEYSLRCDRALDLSKGACVLPSAPGMTAEEQDAVIELLYACFDIKDLRRM